MPKSAEDAVKRALEQVPGSIRAVAREAGVSPTLLRMIRDTDRTATPEVVEKLAAALERTADRYARAARLLRDTIPKPRKESG